MNAPTVENRPVGSEEAVLEALRVVTSLEGILLHNDLVYVLAREKRDFVSSVAVEDAEKGQLPGVLLGCVGSRVSEVELGRVGVLHADAPALHGGQAVDESVILALVGSLGKKKRSALLYTWDSGDGRIKVKAR